MLIDADFAKATGGYPVGAVVPNSANDGFWLNITEGNTSSPEVTDGSVTGWVPAEAMGLPVLQASAKVRLHSPAYRLQKPKSQ